MTGFTALFGQLPDEKTVQLTRAAIQERREGIVRQAIDLTEAEDKAFWPLYKDWRSKSTGLADRRLELIGRITGSQATGEAEARELIDSWLKLEKDALDLKRDYVKRFRKILPERKVARFFHLESKMDAIVNYDLAERVPLVE